MEWTVPVFTKTALVFLGSSPSSETVWGWPPNHWIHPYSKRCLSLQTLTELWKSYFRNQDWNSNVFHIITTVFCPSDLLFYQLHLAYSLYTILSITGVNHCTEQFLYCQLWIASSQLEAISNYSVNMNNDIFVDIHCSIFRNDLWKSTYYSKERHSSGFQTCKWPSRPPRSKRICLESWLEA